MEKIVFLLAASLLLMVSCKNDGKGEPGDVYADSTVVAPVQMQTQEYIEGRISDIYGYAFDELVNSDTDKKFFTPSFYELQEKVMAKQDKEGYAIIDHDHWVMGQDAHNPSYEFVKAEEVDGKTAKAYVKVKAFDNQPEATLVRLTLKYNGDEWMVDDIEEDYDGVFYSHRKMYDEALAE